MCQWPNYLMTILVTPWAGLMLHAFTNKSTAIFSCRKPSQFHLINRLLGNITGQILVIMMILWHENTFCIVGPLWGSSIDYKDFLWKKYIQFLNYKQKCITGLFLSLSPNQLLSNLQCKSNQISKPRCFSSRLAVVFAQSIESWC